MAGRRGNGGPDWGNIDWANFDLRQLGGRQPRTPRPPGRRGVAVTILIVLVLLVPLIVGPFIGFFTDLLWFRSLGLEDVYLRRYTAGFWAFIAFTLIFFVLAVPNLYLALRPQVPRVVVDVQRPRASAFAGTLRWMWLLLIPAFFFGLAGSAQWDPLLRWLNAVPFGVTDPVFGRDIGFYFFTLPVLDFVRGWAIAAVLAIAVGVILVYVLRGVIGVATDTITRGDLGVAGRTALALARPARAHLSLLGGMFLLLIAFGYVIDQWGLLFRQDSVLTGAAYTSINARLPALDRGAAGSLGYGVGAPVGLPATALRVRRAPGAAPVLHIQRRRRGPLPDRRPRGPGDARRTRAAEHQPAAGDVGEPPPCVHPRLRRGAHGDGRRRGRGTPGPAGEGHPAAGRAEDRAAAHLLRRAHQRLRDREDAAGRVRLRAGGRRRAHRLQRHGRGRGGHAVGPPPLLIALR